MLWVWPIAARPLIKPGVSRWPIKTSLAPGADRAHPKPIQILHGKAPSESGRIVKPVYVKVTGQLFYDDAHVGQPPRGKKKMQAATLWEVHPVIDVQFVHPPQP